MLCQKFIVANIWLKEGKPLPPLTLLLRFAQRWSADSLQRPLKSTQQCIEALQRYTTLAETLN